MIYRIIFIKCWSILNENVLKRETHILLLLKHQCYPRGHNISILKYRRLCGDLCIFIESFISSAALGLLIFKYMYSNDIIICNTTTKGDTNYIRHLIYGQVLFIYKREFFSNEKCQNVVGWFSTEKEVTRHLTFFIFN